MAKSVLDQDVRKHVLALLAADTDSLTQHDIATEATWADKYRDANIDDWRLRTRQWHFIDIEIGSPDLDAVCFNHPEVEQGKPASTTVRRATASTKRSGNLPRSWRTKIPTWTSR